MHLRDTLERGGNGTSTLTAIGEKMRRRSLHRLAEEIYYALEGRGVFDDDELPLRNRGERRASFPLPPMDAPKKKKKRKSAYFKRYSAAFKRLAPKYKKKAGGWKKDGFRRCAAAARKAAKK